MERKSQKVTSRKKFIGWAAAILASSSLIPIFRKNQEPEKKQTATMLTEDGTLVEIDKELLSTAGKKISNSELQNWIKK